MNSKSSDFTVLVMNPLGEGKSLDKQSFFCLMIPIGKTKKAPSYPTDI